MGVRLVVEVLKHAPACLDRAERLVLVTVAEDARDGTRISHCGRRALLVATGLGPRGLRKVFERLAKHDLEVRVPLGLDRLGRPLYAVPGQQATYRVPAFAAAKGELKDPHKGELEGRQAELEGRQAELEGRQAELEGPPFPQPSVPQQQRVPPHIAMIMKSTGASPAEAEAVAELVDREKTPKTLGPFLHRLARDGELPVWLKRVRAVHGRAAAADWRAVLKTQPDCEHGVAGGHIPEPGTGWVACPIERTRLRVAGGRT